MTLHDSTTLRDSARILFRNTGSALSSPVCLAGSRDSHRAQQVPHIVQYHYNEVGIESLVGLVGAAMFEDGIDCCCCLEKAF